MRLRGFGGLEVLDGDRSVEIGGPKQRAVLAALLVDLGQPVSADRLVDRVWGDDPPDRAEGSLQAYISNLRRALEPDRKPREPARLLVTRAAGYALMAARDDVDLAHFEDLAGSGHRALDAADLRAATAQLDAALALWDRGAPLPEFAGEPWCDETATRLVQLRVQALQDRFDAGLQLGEHAALVPRIEAAVASEPYHEPLRAQLALALYRAGRQRDALAALHDARRSLVEDVGVEPGAALKKLEADILEQSPALDVAPVAPAPRRAT